MKVEQNRYADHAELSAILRTAEEANPRYVTLETAGWSLEGREIWAVTVTDKQTGPAEDKPAMFVDACIHAGEVTGTQVCLQMLSALLDGAGRDPVIDRILATRTSIFCPVPIRMAPSGSCTRNLSPGATCDRSCSTRRRMAWSAAMSTGTVCFF